MLCDHIKWRYERHTLMNQRVTNGLGDVRLAMMAGSARTKPPAVISILLLTIVGCASQVEQTSGDG